LACDPVTAWLIAEAAQWPHASVRAHLAGRDDRLVTVAPLRERVKQVADLWERAAEQDCSGAFDAPGDNGRPLGSTDYLAGLEMRLGRTVSPGKRGPKPKGGEE
jgi:putative transposase